MGVPEKGKLSVESVLKVCCGIARDTFLRTGKRAAEDLVSFVGRSSHFFHRRRIRCVADASSFNARTVMRSILVFEELYPARSE